jgi:hypothetical protein
VPPWEDFLGKLYSKIELIIILQISDIDCLISCIAFRSTTLAATRSLRSIKSFLHSAVIVGLTRFEVQRHKISCSFSRSGSIVTAVSSSFVCPPRLNNSLTLQIYLQPAFFAAPYHNIVAVRCSVDSVSCVKEHFW